MKRRPFFLARGRLETFGTRVARIQGESNDNGFDSLTFAPFASPKALESSIPKKLEQDQSYSFDPTADP